MAACRPLGPTPTTNRALPFRSAGFRSLVDGLDYAAQGETGLNFYSSRGELDEVLSYAALRQRALEVAARLPSAGLNRGDRVAIVAETSAAFVVAFFGCQYAGMVPVPLPLSINFGGHEAYIDRMRGMLVAAGARAIIAPADLTETAWQAARLTAVKFVGTVDDVLAQARVASAPTPLGPKDPCYIQYSSGSTSFPRGVLVTQQALVANARAIAVDGIALRGDDRCVSWLPLYHDMGLVGCCLTPVMNQVSVDYLATSSFARRPLVWLKLISQNRASIAFSPTFGYELCARRASTQNVLDLDLSRWRVAGIGGEMIRPSALNSFADTFAPAGFDAAAFLPSYGMAEATLAVTFSKLGDGLQTDRVVRGETLERRRLAIPMDRRFANCHGRTFTRCGKPLPGYRVEIRDSDNRRLPERNIGRVCIQGPSLMDGYFRNPQATAAVIDDHGWLDTGDMGYLVDGELVITGRTKDLIIVGGRNIWPQDIEWTVERVDGVRQGDVAAFAVTDDDDVEQVVVIVECRTQDPEAIERIRQDIAATLQQRIGVACKVVMAPMRSLTFTTSGKLSRAGAKARYLDGTIGDVSDPRYRCRSSAVEVAQAIAV